MPRLASWGQQTCEESPYRLRDAECVVMPGWVHMVHSTVGEWLQACILVSTLKEISCYFRNESLLRFSFPYPLFIRKFSVFSVL